MSHLVSKQSHLDVLARDFNMSDVLHVVSGQLEKTKTAGKKTDHVNNPELSFSLFLHWWGLSLHNSGKTTTY